MCKPKEFWKQQKKIRSSYTKVRLQEYEQNSHQNFASQERATYTVIKKKKEKIRSNDMVHIKNCILAFTECTGRGEKILPSLY